jgi:hypothetical protein
MKTLFMILAFAFVLSATVHAQHTGANLGEAKMNLTGINCQITTIKRIPPNRLLVVVRLLATTETPPEGTLIGYTVTVPSLSKAGPPTPHVDPTPFSLASSVMTDEKTKLTYPTLPPVAPPGKAYRPGVALGFLKPNQNLVLTLQFALPPPLPPDPATGVSPQQTVSFMFTNAKGPITHVTLPPPAPTAGAAN